MNDNTISLSFRISRESLVKWESMTLIFLVKHIFSKIYKMRSVVRCNKKSLSYSEYFTKSYTFAGLFEKYFMKLKII